MTNTLAPHQTIAPFTLAIHDDALDDLRARLRATRLPVPPPGDSWANGVPVEYLRHLVEKWQHFDWRAYESRLAAVPQYTTEIDGQRVHFVHVPSAEPGATPLVLTHGWPGSFLEFIDLIGPLTDPAAHGGDPADAFHVVIPSIPGFGFSTPLAEGEWPTRRIAETWIALMDRLGYDRFVVQGGDMGAAISPEIARRAPERVIGVHVNGNLDSYAEISPEDREQLSTLEQDRSRRIDEFMREQFGYIAIQSTRPGLVGELLTDSPAAQLAWIVDKLKAWTFPEDALPEDVLGLDFVLANASLYWFTASGGSAAAVGYAQAGGWGEKLTNSGVPTSVIVFAGDVGIRAKAEISNTVVRWIDVVDRGGHFAALEEPALLVADIRGAFRDGRSPRD
jgi:pimeloyl-ACP methyl ester carboxylesterase